MRILSILLLFVSGIADSLAWIPEHEKIVCDSITYTVVIPEGCVRFDQTHPTWMESARQNHSFKILAAYASPSDIADHETGASSGRGYMMSLYMVEASANPGIQIAESLRSFGRAALEWIDNTSMHSVADGRSFWNGMYSLFATSLGTSQPMMIYFVENQELKNFVFCILHGNEFHEDKQVVPPATLNWCSGLLINQRILLLRHARVVHSREDFDVGVEEIDRWTAATLDANAGN
ncbi:MAG TPA: hypothetical protein VE641_08855 [Chthoniobacterales bacterium]|nr:hypothetical protein [Chthoniobacterales bacterium]